MRHPRRFGAATISTGVALVLAMGCGGGEPTPPPGLNDVQLAGWKAYIDLNCASCHGESRQGKRSGPPLQGLAENWTADELVAYLADPEAVVRANPRLAYKAEQYGISMPAISGKAPGFAGKATPDTLRAVAEYVLVDVQ